ncbi:MAG TPA: metalloregulator ArsR/SmtB family transcription factor [Acidimicrobiales bacterium]|nr:metalloregulator ArsR/SmtB family transcription factor [Acidimicrobiales bacterium]
MPNRPEVEAVFAALADPTRRTVLDQLAEEGPLSATQLAARFPVSRQAVVKHLSALTDAGLVTSARAGREVRFQVTPNGLDEAVGWLVTVGSRWDERLTALRQHLTRRPGAT